MIPLIPPQAILTTGSATNDFQASGLEALGLSAPQLAAVWAGATPAQAAYDAANLTLALSDPRAPFMGVARWVTQTGPWSDLAGEALGTPLFVLELMPEAARRLQIEVDLLTGNNVHPVPVAMVLRDAAPPPTLPPPQIYIAGEPLVPGQQTTVSFHDARGLVIDAIAVAHLWDVLLRFRPGLASRTLAGVATDPGGVAGLRGFATGDLVHVIDPHGWTFAGHSARTQLRVLDNAGARVRDVAAAGIETLAADERIGRTQADQQGDAGTTPLAWGFARNGVLGTQPVVLPPVPAAPPGGGTLGRRFFRVMAVDLAWHLLGNRTGAAVNVDANRSVPADDGATPAFLLPQVRHPVPGFAWLVDGLDLLGTINAMTGVFGNPADQPFAIAVSPAQDLAALACPPAPGAPGHWPQFPPPGAGAAEIDNQVDPAAGITATWRAPADGPDARLDVVLILDGGQLPADAHVRVYPRRFVEVSDIADGPSFVRGDGGSAIAAPGPVNVLLVNPFNLKPAEPAPVTPVLVLDMVVVSRSGRRRMRSSIRVTVGGPPRAWVPPPVVGAQVFANGTLVAQMLDGFRTRAIGPSKLFGLPGIPIPGGATPDITALMRRFASDEQPRQAPRLPTQARFATVVAMGLSPGGAGPYNWQAVLSGGRLTNESRQSQPELANPGQPATPDVYASGIACGGQLAYDLAIHGLKRVQPIFMPTGADSFRGWIATVMENRWALPPQPVAGTVSGVLLETVAAFSDTPELAAAPVPQPNATVQNLVNDIADAIGVPRPTVGLANEQRVVREVQREIVAARSGARDALWSLTRALSEAREFVYIESAAFARTAWPNDPPKAHQIDLVALLLNRMSVNPRLKVMVCVPRAGDFALDRPHWTITALQQRDEALVSLGQPNAERFLAFHPAGYPGRDPAIRTTTVIVDDTYCLCGTSHLRRRGMTFDGAADVAHIDRSMAEGYSAGIAQFRQGLMAAKLGVQTPTPPLTASPLWVRLASADAAFEAIAELIVAGGAGRLQPVMQRKAPDSIEPVGGEIVDPDGVDAASLFALLAALMLEG